MSIAGARLVWLPDCPRLAAFHGVPAAGTMCAPRIHQSHRGAAMSHRDRECATPPDLLGASAASSSSREPGFLGPNTPTVSLLFSNAPAVPAAEILLSERSGLRALLLGLLFSR